VPRRKKRAGKVSKGKSTGRDGPHVPVRRRNGHASHKKKDLERSGIPKKKKKKGTASETQHVSVVEKKVKGENKAGRCGELITPPKKGTSSSKTVPWRTKGGGGKRGRTALSSQPKRRT